VAGRQALVADAVDALNNRDYDWLAAAMDRGFTFYSALRQMEGEVYLGVDGMRQYFAAVDSTWEDFRFEIAEFHDLGARSVLVFRLRGRARASGVPLDQQVAQVWTWRGEKVRQVEGYSDPDEALRAVGLRS
jgi:ketosteroid isomerase-like protein